MTVPEPGTIPVRPLGSQGLVVPAQGLGCMGMSMAYKDTRYPGSEEESLAVLDRTLELGANFLDTSNAYGPHTNEILIGKAIKGRRDKFIIATKFGIVGMKDGVLSVDGSPENVRASIAGSLERLGTGYVDLFYLHRVDRTRPIEETVGEMKKLVEEGKVKYLGLSEATPDEIRRAHAVHPITAVQLEWSLWTRNAEADVIPTCRELGIGIVPYSPLGRGFLTGAITSLDNLGEGDMRKVNIPRFQGENFAKNLELVEAIKRMAASKGATPAQVALAWVHAQGLDVFPIPGTKRVKYLEDNLGALFVELSADEAKKLGDMFTPDKVSGERSVATILQANYEGGI